MFDKNQLNEFINRLFVNAAINNGDIIEGLSSMKKYLQETSMCGEEDIQVLDKLIELKDELLKRKGEEILFDVVAYAKQELKKEELRVVTRVTTEEKERIMASARRNPVVRHSTWDDVPDRQGSSFTKSYTRRVDTSYTSSSCTGGSYRNRC